MKKRVRRTEEQLISDLEQEIAELKKRMLARKATQTPDLKHTIEAVRKIENALAYADDDPNAQAALQAAREPLVAYLHLEGIAVPRRRGRKPGRAPSRDSGSKASSRKKTGTRRKSRA